MAGKPWLSTPPAIASRRWRGAVLVVSLMAAALACGLAVTAGMTQPPASGRFELGPPEQVASGVTLYRPVGPVEAAAEAAVGAAGADDGAELPSPLAIRALAIDPRGVDLTTALSMGRAQGRAPVLDVVAREGAVAGINAGFFVLETGDPTGVLRVDGDLVSDTRLMRGAVAIRETAGRLALTFDRVRVRLVVDVRVANRWIPIEVDGVDTVRRAGRATLYTARFGADTGTPPSGIEWPLALNPLPALLSSAVLGTTAAARARRALKIADPTAAGARPVPGTVTARIEAGRTPIPAGGAVLSFGGRTPPAPLDTLRAGGTLRLREEWTSEDGRDAHAFEQADDVVGGAGLLLRNGRTIDDWSPEKASESLRALRHPRTLIGTDAKGTIWLVTVDGRQPGYSVGLTLPELQRLALALWLTDALNLDGGGSTTMVVRGQIVNRPSDPIGPRAVSDVLLVRPRPAPRSAAPR